MPADPGFTTSTLKKVERLAKYIAQDAGNASHFEAHCRRHHLSIFGYGIHMTSLLQWKFAAMQGPNPTPPFLVSENEVLISEALIICFLGDGTGGGLNAVQSTTRIALMVNGVAGISWNARSTHSLSCMRVKILKDMEKGL